jgi:hypothetical protein
MAHPARSSLRPQYSAKLALAALTLLGFALGCAHDAKPRDDSDPPAASGSAPPPSISGEAWQRFSEQLRADGERILESDFPSAPGARAEGYRHLARLTVLALQWFVDFDDVDFPRFFRHDDDITQWGGPNIDNTYLRARIGGEGTYRLSGNIATVREVIISIGDGDMHEGKFAAGGDLISSQLDVDAEGNFEMVLSATPHPQPWLPIAPGVDFVNIRTYYSDWELDSPAEFQIERIDRTTRFPAPPTPERIADQLARAANWISTAMVYWKDFMDARHERMPVNVLAPPDSVKGGSSGIAYGGGKFELEPDQAVIVETAVPEGVTYWSYQWYTYPWFEAPDYANRQTHLTGDMMDVDADGKVRMVFAHSDPGVPNWIDTEGRRRLYVAYRYVGAKTAPAPSARVVAFGEIAEVLPPDTPRVDEAERAKTIEMRRQHVSRRFRR